MSKSKKTFIIPKLEMHVTHACNLHCDGCSHYSNYAFKKGMTFQDFSNWLSSWKDIISPKQLKLLGGEPSLVNNLVDYIKISRITWPETKLLLTTNGFFINRVPKLFDALVKYNCGIHFSLHSRHVDYVEKIAGALESLEAICRQNDLTFMLSTDQGWVRHYEGIGKDMRPFTDGNYHKSWEKCLSKTCMNLMDNKLFKCPQLAYLNKVAHKFGLDKKKEWQPYINYKGLSSDSSFLEISSFLEKSKKSEKVCGMCPLAPEPYEHDIYSTNFNQPGIKRIEIKGSKMF